MARSANLSVTFSNVLTGVVSLATCGASQYCVWPTPFVELEGKRIGVEWSGVVRSIRPETNRLFEASGMFCFGRASLGVGYARFFFLPNIREHEKSIDALMRQVAEQKEAVQEELKKQEHEAKALKEDLAKKKTQVLGAENFELHNRAVRLRPINIRQRCVSRLSQSRPGVAASLTAFLVEIVVSCLAHDVFVLSTF